MEMASLRSERKKYYQKKCNQLILSGNPSPTIKKHINDFAQNRKCFAERSFLSTAFCRRLDGGMTVEAALALPFFLLFFLNLASLMEMMRLHGNLQTALWEACSSAAVYTCAVEDEDLAASVLSALYIRSRLVKSLGSEYLEDSPLQNGAAGLLVVSDPEAVDEDILSVRVSYSVSSISALIGFPDFRMSNVYYGHIWNGYEIGESASKEEIVYVTENGTVYHLSRNCTHLLLSVRQEPYSSVKDLRNQQGRSYGACGRCAKGEAPETIFVTDEGESFHYSENCAGLKRTVKAISLQDASLSYRACSRCGGAQ
jgi:hypothetical protein